MSEVSEVEQSVQCIERIGILLNSDPANNQCADCSKTDPEWASLGFGTLICLKCAGYHRSIGVHITSVRSLTLDDWNVHQVAALEYGGNQRFWNYLKSTRSPQKYHLPLVLYYTEILKARMQGRSPKEYDESEWNGLVKELSSSSSSQANQQQEKSNRSRAPDWISDRDVTDCMVCSSSFSFFNRKHHCRRCGKVVCNDCAPPDNTRPIIEWGMKEPVRHCKVCYKSPSITWKENSNT